MWLIRQLPHPWNLRVEGAGEAGVGGLDVWEHGTGAYDMDEVEGSLAVSAKGIGEKLPRLTS